jgi:hypothetical protein
MAEARGGNCSELEREQRIAATTRLLQQAMAASVPLRSREVQAVLGVSRPTALRYLRAARQALAHERAQAFCALPQPQPDPVLPARHPRASTAYLTRGIDLTGQLQANTERLEGLSRHLEADLALVRHWLFGAPDGLPSLCVACGRRAARGVGDRRPPEGLGVKDLAALASTLVKAIRELNATASVCTDLLERIYSYESLEQFIADTNDAILEVCPSHRQALAHAMRRRGAGLR